MRVFVTGIAGFVGSHLVDALIASGARAVGGCHHPDDSLDNLAESVNSLALFAVDILDGDALARALASFSPDAVIHLAAVSFVPSDPERIRRVNIDGSASVLRAVQSARPKARIVLASSAEVYGVPDHPEGVLTESSPVRPTTPYGLSKLEMERAANRVGLAVCALRLFNHIGPRQSPRFAVSSFARQIAEIEAGRQAPVLRVGNLSAIRDFTDVRDIARAYLAALENFLPGAVWNVGSGEGHSVADILERFRLLSETEFAVETDPSRVRPIDIPVLVADASAFRAATGWAPFLPLDRTLSDVLADWRDRTAESRA